jgi:hypothetical protein
MHAKLTPWPVYTRQLQAVLGLRRCVSPRTPFFALPQAIWIHRASAKASCETVQCAWILEPDKRAGRMFGKQNTAPAHVHKHHTTVECSNLLHVH